MGLVPVVLISLVLAALIVVGVVSLVARTRRGRPADDPLEEQYRLDDEQ